MKVLLIRRENIGDLILTTPLIAMLARDHQVDMLVNSYNRSVLDGNPHVNKIHLYTKLHHSKDGQSKVGVILKRLKTMLAIRREKYDVAIIVKEEWDKRPLQWAKASGAKRVIAIGEDAPSCITDKLPRMRGKQHLVELLNTLAEPLGYHEEPGPLELYLSEHERELAFKYADINPDLPVYGLQISARKVKQQWPAGRFIELARRLAARENCQLLLFWAPGAEDNPEHPGDDGKAMQILEGCRGLPITPFKTSTIRELMAAMSLCDQVLTSDGGALHIAVGVQRPVVALFGNSDAFCWRPWKVPNRVIEANDRDVNSISTDQVFEAFTDLRSEVTDSKNRD
ncbi:glycosyltransferase family 9 protein [Kosakonia oryziphila]|uniref:ADP-heptose:LPS heptosyltransferase n=1 Tax=Kosakonia oryziphila TaxID=1005667 RepID=A0A1C4A8R5_9ENTR|nr:glycosyltransferase family 9 protein [Kosakonia oryziphila]SCB90996.1 ADP-heptose:LPS heptosyltransferase [Kosakonia oryziphila]